MPIHNCIRDRHYLHFSTEAIAKSLLCGLNDKHFGQFETQLATGETLNKRVGVKIQTDSNSFVILRTVQGGLATVGVG